MDVPQRDACAVVVGATGAMGQQIVRRLAGNGLQVLAVARDAAALDRLAAAVAGVVTCPCNIAKDAATAQIAARLDRPVRMVVQRRPAWPTRRWPMWCASSAWPTARAA